MERDIIRAMALAERMMDNGQIPFVWAPNASGIMERLAITTEQIEEFELVPGQSVNSMIRDAILDFNLQRMKERLQEAMDQAGLDPDFDFRNLLEDEDDVDGD